MAGNQTRVIPRPEILHALGDWLAPMIAVLAVAATILALASALFESAQ